MAYVACLTVSQAHQNIRVRGWDLGLIDARVLSTSTVWILSFTYKRRIIKVGSPFLSMVELKMKLRSTIMAGACAVS
jgi:hypothetical protein